MSVTRHNGEMIDARLPGGQKGPADWGNPGHLDERFGTKMRGRPKPYAPSRSDDQSMADIPAHLTEILSDPPTLYLSRALRDSRNRVRADHLV